MLHYNGRTGTTDMFNAREVAPIAASEDMYASEAEDASLFGIIMIIVYLIIFLHSKISPVRFDPEKAPMGGGGGGADPFLAQTADCSGVKYVFLTGIPGRVRMKQILDELDLD